MELEVTRPMAASQQRIWDVITDLDGAPRVMRAVTSVQRLDGPSGFAVGTRWRETRTMFGREATEEMAVIRVDPPRSYTVEAVSGGTVYTTTFQVEALGPDLCQVRMRFGAEVTHGLQRLLAATLGRAFRGATRRALVQDLDDIAAAVEAVG